MAVVSRPRPSGEYATCETPSRRQAADKPLSCSSREQSENSLLPRGNGVYPRGSLQGLRRGLREAEVAHLAGGDACGHRAHRVLDRRLGVHAVLIITVVQIGRRPAT